MKNSVLGLVPNWLITLANAIRKHPMRVVKSYLIGFAAGFVYWALIAFQSAGLYDSEVPLETWIFGLIACAVLAPMGAYPFYGMLAWSERECARSSKKSGM